MPLPKFLHKYFWSYDVSAISPTDPADRDLIITHILNLGNEKALNWLFKNYSLEQIKSVLKNPWRGVWDKRSLYYWKNVLEVDIPKDIYEKAIFRLEPQLQQLQK